MAEMIEESQGLESTTVLVDRTATVTKGGKRFSFVAMVVVGDRRGNVGIGYGKATGVPASIEKAQKDAKKDMHRVVLKGGTIPHVVEGRFGASSVRLIPAAPGTGVIAGGTVRAVLEMVGVKDCLSKAYGSTNTKNLCKAAIEALQMLRDKDTVAALRGVAIPSTTVDEMLVQGQRYVPKGSTAAKQIKGPVNTVGQKTGGAKGGRGGGRGRRDRDGEGAAGAPETPAAPAAGGDAAAPAAN
jgi:small subunit ribosomal protein S5